MKKKNKKALARKKKQFKFHKIESTKKNGKKTKFLHPAFIFLQKGNVYIFVTLTHSSSVDGKIVVKLRKNPNPNDNADSYWVAEINEDTLDQFCREKKDWKIDELDLEDIWSLYKKR